MWVLVLVNMMYNFDAGYQEPVIEAWYDGYTSMDKCFMARDQLLLDLGVTTGYYPKGTQAICLEVDWEQ